MDCRLKDMFAASEKLTMCSKYTLLRLDAGRLPFETGSLAAIHAGSLPIFHLRVCFVFDDSDACMHIELKELAEE